MTFHVEIAAFLLNDGDTWPLVEKAVAIHSGGWDEIDGGQCNLPFRAEPPGWPREKMVI